MKIQSKLSLTAVCLGFLIVSCKEDSGSQTAGRKEVTGRCEIEGKKALITCQSQGTSGAQIWQEIYASDAEAAEAGTARPSKICEKNPYQRPVPDDKTSPAKIRLQADGKVYVPNPTSEDGCEELTNIIAGVVVNGSLMDESKVTTPTGAQNPTAPQNPTSSSAPSGAKNPTVAKNPTGGSNTSSGMTQGGATGGTSSGSAVDSSKIAVITVKDVIINGEKKGTNTFLKADWRKNASEQPAGDVCVIGSLSQGAKSKTLRIVKGEYGAAAIGNSHLLVKLVDPICSFPAGSKAFVFTKDFADLPEDALKFLNLSKQQ